MYNYIRSFEIWRLQKGETSTPCNFMLHWNESNGTVSEKVPMWFPTICWEAQGGEKMCRSLAHDYTWSIWSANTLTQLRTRVKTKPWPPERPGHAPMNTHMNMLASYGRVFRPETFCQSTKMKLATKHCQRLPANGSGVCWWEKVASSSTRNPGDGQRVYQRESPQLW